MVLAGQIHVETEAEDFKSTVLSENFVPFLYPHGIAGFGFNKGFFYRTVNSGSSRRRVLLLAFVCGNR